MIAGEQTEGEDEEGMGGGGGEGEATGVEWDGEEGRGEVTTVLDDCVCVRPPKRK